MLFSTAFMKKTSWTLLALVASTCLTSTAAPLTTAFTYQGRLTQDTSFASGVYDLKLTLYDAANGGSIAGGPVTNLAIQVTDGLFTTALDFGRVFTDENNKWLEIQVRPSGAGPFIPLNPRQFVGAAPYAQYAPNAGSATMAGSVVNGAITTSMLADGAVTTGKIGPSAVTRTNIDDGGKTAYEEFLGPAGTVGVVSTPPFRSLALFPVATAPSIEFRLNATTLGTVVGFTGREAMSEPYEFAVEVTLPHPELTPEAQVGSPARVLFARNGRSTVYAGLVTACALASYDGTNALYTFRIQSPLSLLALSSNYRINRDISVPALVSQLYQDRTSFPATLPLTTYSQKTSITQMGETDLSFSSRLLEAEGIFYFFEQSGTPPALILGDSPASYLASATPSLRYYGEFGPGGSSGAEFIRTFHKATHQSTQQSTLKSYNFLNPLLPLLSHAESPVGTGEKVYFGGYTTASEGDRLAAIRQGRHHVERATMAGSSTAPDLRPGHTFVLDDRTDSGLGGAYVVTAVRHAALRRLTNNVPTFFYGNEFEAIPAGIPFRPALKTPRPNTPPHTAVVTGPAGEEIYTDSQGRVKVRFHWDRYSPDDETSSAWVRVMTPFAGKGWGMHSVPRVGEEVVVSFLNGDPDDPAITGALYNGRNNPPYSLPDDKTRSGIRTRSSPGGAGYNEIRFEDKAGLEELFVKAQKDLAIHVGHDTTVTITNDLALSVGGNASFGVANDFVISAGRGIGMNAPNNPSVALNVGGTVAATLFQGGGAGLTSLPAGALTGAISDARLSANVALLGSSQTFTAPKTFAGVTTLNNVVQVHQSVFMNDAEIQFRGDRFHGLGWYGDPKLFNGVNVNGPVLYGNSGGGLGTVDGAATNLVAVWTSTGRVGIGTAVPSHLLHVHSTATTNTVRLTGPGVNGAGAKINFGDAEYVNLHEVTDDCLRIQATRLGIGRTPTANRLELEGEASKTSAGGWLANSDARIKTDILSITNALNTLSKLRLVSFRYSDPYRAAHPSLEDRRYLNVLAQEYQTVFPDDVRGSGEYLSTGEEILQVDPWPITIYTAAAAQELGRKAESQDLEIQELKAQNEALQQRLSALERLLGSVAGSN